MSVSTNSVTRFSDIDNCSLNLLLNRYGLTIDQVGSEVEIHGSFWGGEEDAEDARAWLISAGILSASGEPT